MKEYKLYKWALMISLAVILRTSTTMAFGPFPPGPLSPTLDALTDAAEAVEGASAQLLAAQDKLQQLQGEVLNQIKSYVENLGLNLQNTLFNKKKGEPNLPKLFIPCF